MTLRQILAVLWTRKWIIVSVMLCSLLVAAGYLMLRDVSYKSQGVLRMNSVVANGVTSDLVGGVATNFGVETVTSPAVIDVAAKKLGVPGSSLSGSVVKASLNTDSRSTQVYITATGPTPETSQRRANAVMTAYGAYVDAQVQHAVTVLEQRRQEAVTAAQTLQAQVAANPSNSIAATNLASALSRMSSISTELDAIATAGPSTSVLVAPSPGELTVPSVLTVLLLALATGIVLGLAAALIRDQFDNRIRNEDDVEAHVDVPVLGGLVWDRRVAKMRPPLPVGSNERTDLGEGLRTVRSTLQVLVPTNATIVVTSVEPGDGKSFVSANLALAWARAGRNVILVGGDLRRPDLARYYGEAADGMGLSEILEGSGNFRSLRSDGVAAALRPTRYRRLRLLPVGSEPTEPADLLAGDRAAKVMAILRGLADVVIIDAPPALGMADAALLGAVADGTVVLASAGRTDRRQLEDAIAALTSSGAGVLGVVVNRSTRRLPRTYSAYYLHDGVESRRPVTSSEAERVEPPAWARADQEGTTGLRPPQQVFPGYADRSGSDEDEDESQETA